MGTEDDLVEKVQLVEEQDHRMLSRKANMRDLGALDVVVAEAAAEFRRVDIVEPSASRTGERRATAWARQSKGAAPGRPMR